MRLGRTAIVLTAVLLIPCWPALVNGQPFFTLDTVAYLHAAASGAYKLLGIESAWHAPPWATGAPVAAGQAVRTLPGAAQTEALAPGSVVLMARSVYYGVLLLASHLLAGLWIAVLAQSAIVAAAVLSTLRAFSKCTAGHAVTSLLVLAAVTPMAFFVGFLMPDILSGIAILACAHLVTRFDQLGRWERLFWLGALSYAMLTHFSHLLIVAALTVLAMASAARSAGKTRWLACAALVAAMAVAFLGERAFSLAVEKMTGAPPIRPPFLMARLIEDGPGYRYLQATCPGNGLVVCAYLDRLPSSADSFVWDGDTGVFGAGSPQVRRALSGEQARFAWNVVMFDPAGQASASLVNWMRQLTTFTQLTDFSYGHRMREAFASQLPEPYRTRSQATLAAREAFPLQATSYLFLCSASVSALVLVYIFFAYPGAAAMGASRFWEFAGLVLAGVVLNAAVCGVLNGVYDRFQARVVWLVSLLALVSCFQLRTSRQCLTTTEK